jgi:thiamine pyrophosphokinase
VQSLVKLRNQDKKRMEVDGSAVMMDEVTILAYIGKREDQIMSALDKAYKRLRKGKKAGKR